MELDRREMITLIGSVSSSLSLPVSLVSVARADQEDSNDTSADNDSVLRTSFVPERGEGKIQEIRDGEEVQRVEIEDRSAWKMHAQSLMNTVHIEIPVLSQFTVYKVFIDPPFWSLSYASGNGYILDIFNSRQSTGLKTVLFEIESEEKTKVEAGDFDSLLDQTRQMILDELVFDK